MDEFLSKAERVFEFPQRSKCYLGIFGAIDFVKEIVIPDIQRELDYEWIDKLENNILSGYHKDGYFTFNRFEIVFLNDVYYLVDGQHRYVVLNRLLGLYPNIQIEVRVRQVTTEDEMNQWFSHLNNGRPTKIYKSVADKLTINLIRKYIAKKFPNFISNSKHPHRPNINLDKMEQRFIECDFIERSKLTFDKIIEYINRLNDFYQYTSFNQWKAWNIFDVESIYNQCLKKSPTTPLFFGIYKNYEWIDRILYVSLNEGNFSSFKHTMTTKRVSIPNNLRKTVWLKHNDNVIVGSCYCCANELEYDNMECGHKVPLCFGGTTNKENLEPICRSCNSSMGIQDLETFKKKYYT